jgi:hypothetical protein
MSSIALPLPHARAIVSDARKRMRARRLRILALISVVGIAAGIGIPALIGPGAPSVRGLDLGPASGSAGMPATFVGVDQGQRVIALNSHTGAAERLVYTLPTDVRAVASTGSDIFFFSQGLTGSVSGSAQDNIYELSMAGGSPRVLVPNVNGQLLTVSPDSDELAWATWDLPMTPPAPISISMMNLQTGRLRSWKVPNESGQVYTDSGKPSGAQFASLATGLSFLGNNNIAVTSQPVGFVRKGALFIQGTASSFRRLPNPQLAVISTNVPTARVSIYGVPVGAGFEADLVSHGVLSGNQAFLADDGTNQLLAESETAIDRRPDASAVQLLRLTIGPKAVSVASVGELPLGAQPLALDPDGQDLLVMGNYPSGPEAGVGYLARLVSGGHLDYLNPKIGSTWDGSQWKSATW